MESIKTCRVGIGMFVLIMLVMAVPAGADVRTWDGGGSDTEWATTGNWDPTGYAVNDDLTVLSGTPTSAVHVVADDGGTITLDGSAAVANFSLDTYIGYTAGESLLNVLNGANLTDGYGRLGFYGGTSGIATVSGTGSTWTNNGSIYIGGGWSDTGGSGELIIADGGSVSCVHSWLAYSVGSSGTATVSGTGSEWTIAEQLYVGRKGTGTLIITDGGAVSSGFGGYPIYLGYYAGSSGTLTINNGGTVGNTSGYIGYKAGSSGVLTVDGNGSTWTSSGGSLRVGYYGQGTLNITNGGVVSNHCGSIGCETGSIGVVTVNGIGSTWTNNSGLRVSCGGQGTLNIGNGGAVSSESGCISDGINPSTVTISGTGSTWTNSKNLIIGGTSTATLTITDGGALITGGADVPNNWLALGWNGHESGKIIVNGTEATLTSSGIRVGVFGEGELSITNGGTVTSSFGVLGYYNDSSGTVTVSGAGSTWTNSGDLVVGWYNYGTGTLSVINGGAVSNTTGYLGRTDASSGTVTVSGAGSTWTNSNNLYIGNGSTGKLSIIDGGTVSNMIGYLGYGSNGSGEVTVSGAGSTWTNSSSLYIGGSESSAGGTGMLTIDGGAVEVGDTLKIWSPGTVNLVGGTLTAATLDHTDGGAFNFTGGLLNVETFTGNMVNNGGTISPGASPGLMTVNGDLTMNAGAIEMELGGTARGTDPGYDVIDVTGVLTPGGTLDVVLYDSFNPELGNTFDLFDWGGITGDLFGTVNLPGLSGGLDWDDANLYSNGEITVVPEPASATLLLLGAIAVLRRRKK